MIADYKWILDERRPMTARPIPDAPPVTNAVRATNDEEVEGEVGEDMTAAGNGRVRPEGEGPGGDETYHYGWVTGKWGSRTLILQDARTKPQTQAPNATPPRTPDQDAYIPYLSRILPWT